MKIKDLRTGNWVMGNKPFQLTGNLIALYEAREDARKHNILSGNQLPKPIILNEEWLLKFGFEKILENNYVKDLIRVWIDPTNKITFIFYDQKFRKEIKYVHTFQNVVYYLTDEEPTIENNEED